MIDKNIDLTGQRFGRWLVIKPAKEKTSGKMMWECKCDCGTVRSVSGSTLRMGTSKSCGCLRVEKAKDLSKNYCTKHGWYGTRLYRIWFNMKQRCLREYNDEYYLYGGRGITVCDEWLQFIPFKDWALANGYNDSLTIDRINPDGNYEPSNCKWSTMKEQGRNRRYHYTATYHGETKPLFEWAEILGKDYKTLYNRIKYSGFTVERAFEQPIIEAKKRKKA